MQNLEQAPKEDLDIIGEEEIESCVIDQLEPIVENPNLSTKEKAISIGRMIISHEAFSGPIPSPSIIAKYEHILPGSADRIFKMAENQNEHRIKLESTIMPEQQRQSRHGQLFAFLLSLMIIALAGLLIWKEEYLYGVITLTGTLIAIAALFIKGKSSIKEDIADKE